VTPPSITTLARTHSRTDLRVPDVEDSGVGGPDHFHAAPDVLPVEHDVLAAPTDDVLVEAAYFEEVRPAQKQSA
jgi:hypothetical protein